jgi:hypothetical protein
MLWPVPVNVRMNPIFANNLLDINAQCADEEREIYDYPEYGFELDEGQRKRLKAIAAEIVRSHDSQSPVAAISIIGHADQALKLKGAEKKTKEEKVSWDRARHAEEQLLQAIQDQPGGTRVSAMIQHKPLGVGATQPEILNPLNEAQMKRNRRVVFKWSRCVLPAPIIHPPTVFPPRPGADPKDDQNTIFAGNRFKMKIMDGNSVGEVGGAFMYEFMIWDLDNSRAALYDYKGFIGTVGIPPFSECEETDWSKEFSTAKFVQVDQFSGSGTHLSGSIGIASGMEFKFQNSDAVDPPFDHLGHSGTVHIFAGPAKSLGAESGGGPLKLIPGSIKVFNGP